MSEENVNTEEEAATATVAEPIADAVGLAESAPSTDAPVEPVAKKVWYVVHTQSGFENKVQANLEKRIKMLGVGTSVHRILIPTEEVAEMREGKRKISRRKFFPGYVLVEMKENDKDAWHVIRNTPGVTNFVGADGKPQSLPEDEVRYILKQMGMLGEVGKPKVKPKVDIEVGESIR
ncbi:MAG: transcription termination/antitermination protein NusG, partial [Candidatus Lindowbacteria bacterium]|nr:transcription termination/antitermination protein NusG [Candidatus Lindowbacteria bacterium]